ncbi:hypothetical protein RhiTH_003535 [Rhizoctonia solani]
MADRYQLAAGEYYLLNRVLDSNGRRLYATHGGDGSNVTVTPYTGAANQKWVVENYQYDAARATTLQRIKPADNQRLEAGLGPAVNIRPTGNYVYGITHDGSGWTYVQAWDLNASGLFADRFLTTTSIRDGDKSISWSIQIAAADSQVVPLAEAIGEKQRWVIYKVGTDLP